MKATIAVVFVVLAAGCHDHDHGHGHGGDHGHDDGHEHGGHGGSEEFPAESITLWTDKAELFMEWDALTVGHESRFLAHITNMKDAARFQAVAAGAVTVTLTARGGQPITVEVGEPARLGIFIPALTPTAAGPCTLTVELASQTLSERFDITPCVVHADAASAIEAAQDDEPAGQIGFLKEQQWPIAFATAAVARQDIVPSVAVNARIAAVPGREARLTASTSGRLILGSPLVTLGSAVAKGQVLARIQPMVAGAPGNLGTLRAEHAATKAEHAAALVTHARLEKLVASDSIPRRRLDEAAADLAVTEARLQAATTRLASYQTSAAGTARATAGAFRVTSPVAGTLVEQRGTEGETVAAGALLFSVIDLDRVWVEGRVFEPDVPRFEAAKTAWFTVDGRDTIFEIIAGTGNLVTLGHVIDPRTRTVPVVFEVDNPGKKLRIGQFARLSVATGEPAAALVIPRSAVVQDGNQTIAFAHVSGEAFERRVVVLGTRSRGVVEVRSGLSEGERVVTVGAYDVKLAASAGGAPAHGHAH